jgi:hypothetical protein
MIFEDNIPLLHSLTREFLKLDKSFMCVLEGQPTFFKETQQYYYVVTAKNGLIGDANKDHIKIESKFHNNIQKVSSKDDENYLLFRDWLIRHSKEALK